MGVGKGMWRCAPSQKKLHLRYILFTSWVRQHLNTVHALCCIINRQVSPLSICVLLYKSCVETELNVFTVEKSWDWVIKISVQMSVNLRILFSFIFDHTIFHLTPKVPIPLIYRDTTLCVDPGFLFAPQYIWESISHLFTYLVFDAGIKFRNFCLLN